MNHLKRVAAFKEDQRGFTLVELVIVIAVIGLLIGIAIPVYNNVVNTASDKADKSNVTMVENAVEMYRAENGKLPTVSGESGEARFNSLVTVLHDAGYLKQSSITANEEGAHYEYDSTKGTVTLVSATQ